MEQETMMEERLRKATFLEVERDMKSDPFWIRLFIRPCCVRPDERGAHLKIEGLRLLLSQRADFSLDQHRTLAALINEREAWYIDRFC